MGEGEREGGGKEEGRPTEVKRKGGTGERGRGDRFLSKGIMLSSVSVISNCFFSVYNLLNVSQDHVEHKNTCVHVVEETPTLGKKPRSFEACSLSNLCLSCSIICLLYSSILSCSRRASSSASCKQKNIIDSKIQNNSTAIATEQIGQKENIFSNPFSLKLDSPLFNQSLHGLLVFQLFHTPLLSVHLFDSVIFGKLLKHLQKEPRLV